MRLDAYLVHKAFVRSREAAKRRISTGDVYINGIVARKASQPVTDKDVIKLNGEDIPFVSRGGLKLKAALLACADFFTVHGNWLDVGSSTGGFTHCLLKYGANNVIALDVGSNQLHPSLREDARVTIMENTNAREMVPDWFPSPLNGAVMDVSFISVTKIVPGLRTVLKEGSYLITLIKPQFEAGKRFLNKRGIVTDSKVHKLVLEKVTECLCVNGFQILSLLPSPIVGQDGNREFLAVTKRSEKAYLPTHDAICQCLNGKTVLISAAKCCIKTE